MKPSGAARYFSTAFLAFAAVLAACGIAGLTMFVGDEVAYFDDRVYFFLWGFLLLVLGQCLRLHFRRQFMVAVALAGLLLFWWRRGAGPAPGNADAGLLGELIVMCLAMLSLALADRWLQRVIDLVVVGPWRALRHKAKAIVSRSPRRE